MARDSLPKGTSISLSLTDGDPDGLREATINLSIIRAHAFRFTEFKSVKSEIERPGVYVLLGTDERKAYIGESEQVASRLPNHRRDKSKSY